MRRILTCFASLAAACLLCCSAQAKVPTVTISVPDPVNSYVYQIAAKFGQSASTYADGTLTFKVIPDGTLYNGNSTLGAKLLGSGDLPIMLMASSVYANLLPSFNLLALPFLFKDQEQLSAYLQSELGTRLYNKLNRLGITVIARLPRSFRVITSSVKPVTCPEDLENLRLRVPNNALFVDFFQSLGASPVPMDFAEVYNALQLGVLEAQENPIDVPCDARFYEVQKYVSLTNHMADAWILGINTKFFESLTDKQRQALQKAGDELHGWNAEKLQGNTQEKIRILERHGMQINELTPQQKQQFSELAAGSYAHLRNLIEDNELFDATLKFISTAKP
ncbi:MAG: DctP family TRAP transporter solute-binding subunit [Succinivibrio sp.]|nr:DctP family TRAP transporter solute-binding subunit [Succinivibrio sp.]